MGTPICLCHARESLQREIPLKTLLGSGTEFLLCILQVTSVILSLSTLRLLKEKKIQLSACPLSLCGLCCSKYKRTLSLTLVVKHGFSENAPQTFTFTGKSLLCSLLTGLCLRIKLQRCLPFRHKVKCLV